MRASPKNASCHRRVVLQAHMDSQSVGQLPWVVTLCTSQVFHPAGESLLQLLMARGPGAPGAGCAALTGGWRLAPS